MPISQESFEQGAILPRAEILAFLNDNPEFAYTEDEIHTATRTTLEYSIDQIRPVLQHLLEEKRIESRVIEGKVYYRVVRRRMGFQV